MTILNKVRLALLGIISLVATLFLASCTCPCPQPLIAIEEEGGVTVTPDSLDGVTTVTIYVSNGEGQPVDTIQTAPGQGTLLAYENDVSRPIQLHFEYKNASGQIVAEDCLKVQDLGGGGITLPDVDVVMGVTTGPANPCPNLQNPNSPIATGTGQVSFPWSDNEVFEVQFTCGGAAPKKILIKTEPSPTTGLAGITRVYQSPLKYSCLSDIPGRNPMEEGTENTRVLQLTVVSAWDCTITGTDNNVQGSPRQISIVGPSGCNIRVTK